MAMGSLPSARRGTRRAPMAEINVTPLVDVMLVLLIIFMITAPLLVSGVPVNLPDSRARALDQEQKPTIVSVERDGTINIDEEPIEDSALSDRLASIRNKPGGGADGLGGKPPLIYLRADKALTYARVMFVMGELNQAGLTRIALVSTGTNEAGVSQGSGEQD